MNGKIKFSEIRRKQITDTELIDLISKRLNKASYFHSEEYLIVFEFLNEINFRSLRKDPQSVEAHCIKLFDGLYGKLNFDEKWSEPIHNFFSNFLGFETLPIVKKQYLEQTCFEDISSIEGLIDYYQSLEFIQKFLDTKATPRNHEQNTQLEFYKRTLKKRDEIFSYLLHQLQDRAIKKAKKTSIQFDINRTIKQALEQMADFPYRELKLDGNWKSQVNFEKLDYRKINPLRNKREVFNFKNNIEKGYNKKIDDEILQTLRPSDYLNRILKKIKQIPIIKNRARIFNELRDLYLAEKWYGFYALALPQVEGLFSEMVTIIGSTKQASLSDKVQRVRAFYESSEYTFDYYEYYLPNQRNKFSHTGKDENIKSKCAYLLLDLDHILIVFEALNSPLLQVSKIIKEGPTYFQDISSFATFINVLEQTEKNRQLEHIQKSLDRFMQKLISSMDFDIFFDNLQFDFDNAAKKFETNLQVTLLVMDKPRIDFFSLSMRDLAKQVKTIELAFNESAGKIIFIEEFKLLIDTCYFLSKFPNYFKNPSAKTLELIASFRALNEPKIERINLLYAKTKVELPQDFFLTKREWKHTLT